MSNIVLNNGQEKSVDAFAYWYRHPETRHRPWFELSGPAGSGKTTVVFSAMEEIGIKM